MAYTTSAEVAADFKDIEFDTDTLVLAADVDQFIVEADALINSYVGMKYVVPITAGASALALMKLYSRTLVSNRIKALMEVKQQSNQGANQNIKSTDLTTKDVLKLLDEIKKGNTVLDGATPLVTNGGLFSSNAANNRTRVFHKDCKEW